MESNPICQRANVYTKVRCRTERFLELKDRDSRVLVKSKKYISKSQKSKFQRGYATSIILISITSLSFFSLITIYLKLDLIHKKDIHHFKREWKQLGEKYEK